MTDLRHEDYVAELAAQLEAHPDVELELVDADGEIDIYYDLVDVSFQEGKILVRLGVR